MSRNQWVAPLKLAVADGTAIHTTTTETIIFPDIAIPADYMNGERALRLWAMGKLSTTGTPTITFAIRWGGVAGTILATTEALTCGSGVSNVNWSIEAIIQTRLSGTAGSLLVMGVAHLHTAAGTVLTNVFGVSGYDAPAAVGSLDLTAAANLSLTADWSANSASNTLTGMMYTAETLN